MKKRVLLLGYNFYPEPTGIGKYSGEMMQWLARHDYDCSVVTTYPYYPYWKIQDPYTRNRFWYKTEALVQEADKLLHVHRVPMYVPKNPSGLKRILLDFSFSATATAKLLHLFAGKRFDYVIVVAPSFQFGLLGILCKKVWGAKLIYHIQDMQIEAARDLNMIKSKKAIDMLFKAEKMIFDQSDVISSVSEGMVSRIAAKAHRDIKLFPNWADVKLIHPLPNKAELKESFGFNASDRIALYSGAIGEKQGLEAILYAAKGFEQDATIKFAICGSGPYEKNLQSLAASLELSNLVFLPLQPVERLNSLLNIADVHLVIQKANASDLVMPSKLTNILAVGGLALVTANADSSLYKLIHKYKMGLVVPAENQEALNQGLQQAFTEDMGLYRQNARLYAEKYLDIESVMSEFAHSVLRA